MITFLEVEDSWEEKYLRGNFHTADEVRYFKETAQKLKSEITEARVLSVFIKSKIDKKLITSLPNLKIITTRSTGFDHIDLAAAKERGIVVSNVPVYGENTVAEHTFALILSLARNLRKSYLRTVQNNFSIEGLMGFDLKGKTLGVVGTGHIGLHVIRMGIGFEMKVIAFDVKMQKTLSEKMNFEYVSFEELLKKSDIISLHVPDLPSTHHLINDQTIRLIKRGAVLINTARGGLVETGALVKALDEKILSGAGLDVLEDEEYILEDKRLLENSGDEKYWSKLQTTVQNQSLLHRENVIFTPHLAFYSREAVQKILNTTAENISAFLSGQPLNKVN